MTTSSATFAGQPSTCVSVTVRGKAGKYCVTKQGILSYSGERSSSYFKLTKYSSKPSASLFSLPAGATTQTSAGGRLHPVGHWCRDSWQESDVPRGAAYDRRFEDLASAGMDVHGEATLVDSYGPGSVLDAGCGTGRVAIELNRRGHEVLGVDVDPAMLEAARAKAPELEWVEGDLTDPELDLGRTFDVVVMAGNVLIFVPPGTEGRAIANAARWLVPGGRLVAGYSIRPRRLRAARARRPGRRRPGSCSRTAGRRGTAGPSRRPAATPCRSTDGKPESS